MNLLKISFCRKFAGTFLSTGRGSAENCWALTAGFDQLVHQVVDRPDHFQTERGDEVVILARHRHELGRTEQFAVAHDGLHDLRKGLALFAVQYRLLFIG